MRLRTTAFVVTLAVGLLLVPLATPPVEDDLNLLVFGEILPQMVPEIRLVSGHDEQASSFSGAAGEVIVGAAEQTTSPPAHRHGQAGRGKAGQSPNGEAFRPPSRAVIARG